MDVPTTAPELRPGFYNEVIGVLKFRTIHIDRADPFGAQRTVRNDPRVTRLGRVLRWLSFDGLPQLINVIRGDMSLVAPACGRNDGRRPSLRRGGRALSASSSRQARHHRLGPGQWVARRGRY